MRKLVSFLLPLLVPSLALPALARAEVMLVPMDTDSMQQVTQGYGLVYWAITEGAPVEWALYYRGGSFLLPSSQYFQNAAKTRGVRIEILDDAQEAALRATVDKDPLMGMIDLTYAPRIALFGGGDSSVVASVLTGAGIPWDSIYDPQVLDGTISDYDWVDLHHQHLDDKNAVSLGLRDYIKKGGFVFAMCSAADTLELGMAHTPKGWNFDNTLAFSGAGIRGNDAGNFTLRQIPAKENALAAILVQNYTTQVAGFEGETTSFSSTYLKKGPLVLGTIDHSRDLKYLHGRLGRGFWTYYAGHGPVDTAGMRLILDNVFVPSAKRGLPIVGD